MGPCAQGPDRACAKQKDSALGFSSDLASIVALHASPTSFSRLAASSSVFCVPLLRDEVLWRALCRRHSLPSLSNPPASWRQTFRDGWVTRRSWARGQHRWWAIDTRGQLCLAIDGCARHVLSAAAPDAPCSLWDVFYGSALGCTPVVPAGAELSVATFAGPDAVAWGSRTGDVGVRDVRCPLRGAPVWRGRASGAAVDALAACGDRLVSAAADGSVCEWDVRSAGVPVATKSVPGDASCAVAVYGRCVAAGTHAGRVVVDGRVLRREGGCAANCLLFADGDTLVVGDDSGRVSRLSVRTGEETLLMAVPDAAITCMHVSRSGRLVAGATDGVIRSVELRGHAPGGVAEIRPHYAKHAGRRAAIWQVHTDGAQVLSASLDRRMFVHDFGPQQS